MRLKYGLATLLCVSPLLASAPALSDSAAVKITNDGTDDIMLTVYDMSLGPRTVILSQRVNGFATVPVNVTLDDAGLANVAWSAVTLDPSNRKCGHAKRSGLGESAAVNVHADAECGTGGAAAMTPTSFDEE